MRTRALVSLLALSLAHWHCTSPSAQSDASESSIGSDASLDSTVDAPAPDTSCPGLPPLRVGSPDGAPAPFGAPARAARAGRLTADSLPPDPTGLALWAAGDYVLANDHLALFIEGVRASSGNDPWGGKPIGLSLVRDGRAVLPGDFSELLLLASRFTVRTERVSVLRDGTDGGRAVVRAEGPLAPQPFFDELARGLLPGDHGSLRGAIDYELEGDSDTVQVWLEIASPRPRASSFGNVAVAIFQRERMPLFVPDRGFVSDLGGDAVPWAGYIFDSGASFAWLAPTGSLTPFLSVSGFDSFQLGPQSLEACGVTRFQLGRLVIAGPGLDGLQSAVARLEGTAQRMLEGTVLEASGAPAAGVRVHATRASDGAYRTRAATDASGRFALRVPANETVALTTWRTGDAPLAPTTLAPGAPSPTLRLQPTGTLRVQVVDRTSNAALPARVQLLPLDGAPPSVPSHYGETQVEGRVHLTFPAQGEVVLRAPPGRYRAVVSRGFEYELFDSEVRIDAGTETPVRVALSRVVATDGALCGDFHVHTHRSFDASDDARFKLLALVGEGVELAVRSDHEYVADFEPLLVELGLQRFALGIPSLELTTVAWGHFGIVPLPPDSTRPNAGAFLWAGLTPQEVFRTVRAHPAQPTIIVNHPSVGPPGGAYFPAVGFDRARGEGTRAGYWDTAFTALEVFNDSDYESNRTHSVEDWFALLRAGRRVFATGSSDSHHILRHAPVGYPRTCVFVGTDDPRATNANAVRDAVAQGRSTIFGGVYVTLRETTRGASHGQIATGVGPQATLELVVRAAPWIATDRVELVVDGATLRTLAMDASTQDPTDLTVRLRAMVTVPVATAGSWVLAAAHGTAGRTLDPVYPGRQAFGASNPVFLAR